MISLLSTKLLAIAAIVAAIWLTVKSCGSPPSISSVSTDQMDDQADAADQREQHEPRRQHAAAGVMGDEAEEVEADQRRQFRFARRARPEHVGDFDDLQSVARGQDEIDQDLEAVRRQPRRELGDDLAAAS